MKSLIFVLSMLYLVGCASTSKIRIKSDTPVKQLVQREVLIGKWLGEAPTADGLKRITLMHRREDGTYTVNFKFFKGENKIQEQTEAGIWGVSGNVYFTATREILKGEKFEPANTSSPLYYNAYQILELVPEIFKYKNLETQNQYQVKKVSDTYPF